MVKVTLPNGTVLEGAPEEVAAAVRGIVGIPDPADMESQTFNRLLTSVALTEAARLRRGLEQLSDSDASRFTTRPEESTEALRDELFGRIRFARRLVAGNEP